MTRQRHKTRSLKARLRWLLAICVCLPVVIVGTLAILRARTNAVQQVNQAALAQIRLLAARLDSEMQAARRTVELAAAEWADATQQHEPASAGQRRLRRLRLAVPALQTVSILNPDGTLRLGDPLPASSAAAPADAMELGRHSFGGYIGDAIGDAGQVYIVVQARARNGQQMGVLVCAIDVAFVRASLERALLGEQARLVVLDSVGQVIAASDGTVAKNPSIDNGIARAQANVADGVFDDGTWVTAYRNLASLQSLRGLGWVIVHQQPTALAYALPRAAMRDTAIVAALALLVALGIGGWLAGRLVAPLAQLANRADQIAAGEFAAPPQPIAGPGEVGLLASRMEDMAARLAERATLQAALARGDRLATIGVMSAQLAHEINNPLTTVLGYAQLLTEDKPDDHPDVQALHLIASEAARMKKTVATLLSYSRAETAPSQNTDEYTNLQQTVAHALALTLPMLKNHQVTTTVDVPPAVWVTIAGRSLEQVLVNLLHNAAQAVSTVTATAKHVTLQASLLPSSHEAQLVVEDNGPGVPPAARSKIFDPFYSTKQASAGTGLGLAVSKHLITKAGGSIEVTAGQAGGARFVIVLPLYQAPAPLP